MRLGLLSHSLIATFLLAAPFFAVAETPSPDHPISIEEMESKQGYNVMDELDPYDPAIEQKLERYDEIYEQGTGQKSHYDESGVSEDKGDYGDYDSSDESTNEFYKLFTYRQPIQETCVREQCEVWAQVVKSTQTMYLYVRGSLVGTWRISSGIPGRGTPNFDRHPDGRIYDRYTSIKFPGGDYQGLGNMPYAVFIQGGFAIHGTAQSNWKRLGSKASHGCIRIHPDNAYYFNRLVRQVGIRYVWITVQE